MLVHAFLSIALATLIRESAGKITASVGEVNQTYDFVVVGGGTAGLVIANRLTEEDFTVLVLEAGGDHSQDMNITIPFFCQNAAPFTEYDWNYTTVPQNNLENRELVYPRGFLLGGSSSINYMAYTRASKEDWDLFETETGDGGWSWDAIQKYIFRNEKLTPPADHRNVRGEINPAIHGHHGVNKDSLPGFIDSFDTMVIQVSNELPEIFPYNSDPNGPVNLGLGWDLGTMFNGSRSSSATSYLAPQFASRQNLDVLIGARVTKILPSPNSTDQRPNFSVVEFLHNGDDLSVQTVTASKEIILSAGSINTPVILLHSGIGDTSELLAMNITPIVNASSVGKNLTDHPIVGNTWLVNSTETYERFTRNATKLAELVEEWNNSRTGPLVDTVVNQLAWLRLPDIDPAEDPSAGPDSAHFELLFANGVILTAPPAEGNFMGISAALVTPTSRGTVTINSTNPLDPPLINPNFLDTKFDKNAMRSAVLAARNFAAAPVFSDYIISSTTNSTTDAEIDAYIQSMAESVFHPVSTAKMSPADAEYGVVDPDLKVKGVTGLRIVDASVLPHIPAAHPQAVVYIFAERGSDLIKESW
ncbi:aryl-alcohol oxidase-like protein [Gymnopus androsaceus JB14]|uniref:Aryl-alcohol oxidase-like protein n=1 Tax=Gymnopus androsaceus JB14 TaxID=1447944 RepID=A0A6A4HDB8_9AGAR|nr:aryl-alcohol oxidase-like protein [Gymnopus androsaceus JB14]